MRYFLGVDQGGTKTAAVVCDEQGHILGSGLAGGLVTVYTQDHEEIYIKNIRQATAAALEGAGLGFGDVAAACGCLNGADWSFEYPFLAKSLHRAVYCRDVTVLNDCIGAMRGGSPERQCAVVCVGTGLNVAVRRRDGRQIVFGYYIRDCDQGASALGRAMIDRVMDAHCGLCGPTELTGLLLEHAGYPDVPTMMIRLTVGGERLVPKELAQLLLAACRRGDPGAVEIIDHYAERIARYLWAGIRDLGIQDEEITIVYSGSVLKDDGVLLARRINVAAAGLGCQVREIHARYEPVCGALLTLLDRHWAASGPIPPEVLAAFDKGADALGLVRDLTPKTV